MGKYGTKAGIILKSEACLSCAAGRYNPSTGQTSCLLICPSGRYGNVTKASSVDEGCPNTCPLGRYGYATGKTTLTEACEFICEPGKYGSRVGQNSESDCLVCPNGYFCEQDGLKTPCPLGKYGASKNTSYKAKEYENNVCQACPASKYGVLAGQSKLKDACMNCPSGRFSLATGLKNDTGKVKDYCPKSCGVGFYLDSTVEDNQCTRCPHGAFCSEGIDASGMVAKAGYWRVPNTTRFIACLNPCASTLSKSYTSNMKALLNTNLKSKLIIFQRFLLKIKRNDVLNAIDMSERIKEKEIKELDTSTVDIITNDEHGLNTKSISIEVPKIQLNTSEIKLKIKSELKTKGIQIFKHPRKGKPEQRLIWLSKDESRLEISKSDNSIASNTQTKKGIIIKNILFISKGCQSDIFQRNKHYVISEKLCFSLVVVGRTFDFEILCIENDNELVIMKRDMVVEILQDLSG